MYIFKMTDEARRRKPDEARRTISALLRKELPISNEGLAMVEKAYKSGTTHARWSEERW